MHKDWIRKNNLLEINPYLTEDVFSNHKILKEAHLRPPKSSEILHRLQKRGLEVEPNKLTPVEACDEIMRAKIKQLGMESK